MVEYPKSVIQIQDLYPVIPTEWSKIEMFLEEQTKFFYEVMEDQPNNSSYLIDRNVMKSKYETNFSCLENYIEKGINTGEFAPLYPISICVEMLITTLEGLHYNSRFIYTNKKTISEQMDVVKEQLKDILVVI